MKQIIGILGGMGPRATVVFEQLLLNRFTGTDQDLPSIITINDGSIPDRSHYLLGKGADPLPQMVKNAEVLESAGSAFICVPCNTACAPQILLRLQRQIGIPVLSLPQEVSRYLQHTNATSIYLLATEGTVRLGVFQNALKQTNHKVVLPSRKLQASVDKVIRAIKENDFLTASLLGNDIKIDIIRSGCSIVLLGCTELPLVKNVLVPNNCTVIDTLEVLADACVGYTTKHVMENIS